MAATKTAEPPPPQDASVYPAIESFIEYANADEIGALLNPLKAELATLKGPKAEQAKKVSKAIERTEELLSYLVQVRERLEAERTGGGEAKR